MNNLNANNLKWDLFPSHVQGMMKEMLATDYLTDVTLIFDDQRSIRAHKVILGAGSPVFKNIIANFQERESVIYLKGINYEHMKSVLSFVYLGEVRISVENLNDVLVIAKEFEIKGLLREENKVKEESKNNLVHDKVELGLNLEDPLTFKDGVIANPEDLLTFKEDPGSGLEDAIKQEPKMKEPKKRREREYPMPCPDCGLKKRDRYAFEKHLNSHKPRKREPKCDQPKKTQQSMCIKCGKNFPNRTLAYRCMARHKDAEKREVHCDFGDCKEVLRRKIDYVNHMLLQHKKVVKIMSNNSKHTIAQDDIEYQHVCQDCGKGFVSNFKLRRHCVSMHSSSPMQHVCEECGKGFKVKSKLKDHILRHNPPTKPCPFCDKLLPTNHYVQKHIKNHHVEAEQKLYQCNECDYSTNINHYYEGHKNGHKNVRPYQCSKCDKAYRNRFDLYCHERKIHPGMISSRDNNLGDGEKENEQNYDVDTNSS